MELKGVRGGTVGFGPQEKGRYVLHLDQPFRRFLLVKPKAAADCRYPRC